MTLEASNVKRGRCQSLISHIKIVWVWALSLAALSPDPYRLESILRAKADARAGDFSLITFISAAFYPESTLAIGSMQICNAPMITKNKGVEFQ